jgi:gamma-glutamyltranspeptidase/glutathione hydrolase
MGCDPAALIAPERLRAWADDIDPRRARAVHRLPLPGGGTVLLVTADRDGRMVAMIQSNFRGFGSGIVVPGTGISLHNRACGFVSTPGHPNRVDGGKRPFHTIIPGFFTRESAEGHRAIGPFGCMGAEMQAQGHLQLWQRMFRWGQAPQAAIDAKRWRLERGGSLLLEPGWQPAVAQALEERGHRVREAPANRFGGAQVLMLNEAGDWEYGSESRKDGAALRC